MEVKGSVGFSPEGYVLDLDLEADALDWEKIRGDEQTGTATEENGKEPVKDPERLPFEGVLHVKAKRFTYGDYVWEPMEANVTLGNGKSHIELTRAVMCGITTAGTIELNPFRLKLDLDAKGRELEPALECFYKKKGLLTGTFDLKGAISIPEYKESFAKSLDGDVEFNAKDGRIFRFNIVSKIFSVLNLTEIYKGAASRPRQRRLRLR